MKTTSSYAAADTDERSIMTVPEVAQFLHFHRVTIYRLIEEGTLHPFKVGRLWRFNRGEVEDLIKASHQRPS